MYRNKSAVSLRTLAHSLKHSITIDRQKTKTKEFVPLRNSASSINLIGTISGSKTMPGNSNTKGTKTNDEYLIMLETRKPNKISDTHHPCNRDSNYSEVRYDIRATKDLMHQRKQRLLEITRAQSLRRFQPINQARTPLPHSQNKDELTCTLSMLHQEQSRLKQLIQQKYSSNALKSCNKHIIDAQKVGTELKEITQKYNQFYQHKSQLQNRLMFLEEEILSTKMNFNQRITQKDQCEQFLQAYREDARFQQEAEYVMRLVVLQYEVQNSIETKRKQLQHQLYKLQSNFSQWKVQENIEFKQNKFQNKLKELKLTLMKVETDLDSITNDLIQKYQGQGLPRNTIRKIREYICTFFKTQAQYSVSKLSYGEIEQGMDFFLCKNGLLKEFIQFVTQNTSKISFSHGTYSLKLTQYFDCLKKIENLYKVQNSEVYKAVFDKFQDQIFSLKKQIQVVNEQKAKKLSQIDSVIRSIEKVLSEDSLSIIQLLSKQKQSMYPQFSKQDGLLNLCEIKSKVKESKIDQQKRIFMAKQNYIRLKQLEKALETYAEQNPKNEVKWAQEKETLIKQIKILHDKIKQIQLIKIGYESKKTKLDFIIDDTISKIKQKDQTQQRLVTIQKQIELLKKQKIQQITKKHEQTKNNQLYSNTHNTKSRMRPFSSLTNLIGNTQKVWPATFTSNLPQPFFQIGTLKRVQEQRITQDDIEKSAQFRMTREQNPTRVKITLDEQKMSTKTQSSPKNPQQRLSLGALNSILLSKCNLVQSKNLIQAQSKTIARSGSIYGGKKMNKQNEFHEDQLLLESKPHSRKPSNATKKQNTSRKNSVSKSTLQKSTTRNLPSNQNTGTKLSLSTNARKPSIGNKVSSQSNQSPYLKPKPPQKDLNSLITNKLLRR